MKTTKGYCEKTSKDDTQGRNYLHLRTYCLTINHEHHRLYIIPRSRIKKLTSIDFSHGYRVAIQTAVHFSIASTDVAAGGILEGIGAVYSL